MLPKLHKSENNASDLENSISKVTAIHKTQKFAAALFTVGLDF